MSEEYIRKQDAVNVVANTEKIVASFNYQYAIDALLALTPADVTPVVHGRWEKKKDSGLFYCSECGLPSMHKWPYCEQCGAKMDGERKE